MINSLKRGRMRKRMNRKSKYNILMDRVPFEKKVAFTESVRRLTNDGLTKLVKKCKELCPDVLEDVDSEKLHIKVDAIDKDSFEKLTKLVEDNLNSKTTDSGRKRQKTD